MVDTMTIVQSNAEMSPSDPQQGAIPTVAVIGSGYWGKNLVRNFAGLGALSVVCDSQADTLRALSEQYPDCRTLTSYEEVLRDESTVRILFTEGP